ncbi:MAG: hypothetical protein H7Y20_00870 [Bryobacteraceae bacterium]|nr:hypothetical protein [Bryobacteraceae bacterium]
MKLRSFAMAFTLMALTAISMFASDVDGKWTASMTGPNGQSREVTFNLKADGDKLTGTMSGRQGDQPIEDGKIDGKNISFSRTMGERKMSYKGSIEGDELKMKVSTAGGEMPDRDVVAKRAK